MGEFWRGFHGFFNCAGFGDFCAFILAFSVFFLVLGLGAWRVVGFITGEKR